MYLTRESVVIKLRIWSKRLIPILPTKQLKAMRYELGDMIKQYPNIKHPLVKFANNYNSMVLYDYFRETINELAYRNINMSSKYNEEIMNIACEKGDVKTYFENPSLGWTFSEDDDEYFKICYWNLYEKHLRKIITDEEWKPINDLYWELDDKGYY